MGHDLGGGHRLGGGSQGRALVVLSSEQQRIDVVEVANGLEAVAGWTARRPSRAGRAVVGREGRIFFPVPTQTRPKAAVRA